MSHMSRCSTQKKVQAQDYTSAKGFNITVDKFLLSKSILTSTKGDHYKT